MFVWMAKFGAAYGVRTGIHVGVDVLINRLDDSMRAKFIIFGLLAGALFTGIVATLGAHFVWENGTHYAVFTCLGMDVGDIPEGPTTPDLEWPTWIVYSRDSARLQPDVLPLPAGVRAASCGPANCRTTITAMSMASRKRRCRSMSIPTAWTTTCTRTT